MENFKRFIKNALVAGVMTAAPMTGQAEQANKPEHNIIIPTELVEKAGNLSEKLNGKLVSSLTETDLRHVMELNGNETSILYQILSKAETFPAELAKLGLKVVEKEVDGFDEPSLFFEKI